MTGMPGEEKTLGQNSALLKGAATPPHKIPLLPTPPSFSPLPHLHLYSFPITFFFSNYPYFPGTSSFFAQQHPQQSHSLDTATSASAAMSSSQSAAAVGPSASSSASSNALARRIRNYLSVCCLLPIPSIQMSNDFLTFPESGCFLAAFCGSAPIDWPCGALQAQLVGPNEFAFQLFRLPRPRLQFT
jgi:hypothetical protein